VRRFLDYVRGDRLYAAFVLAATTGMRRGEVLGLRWLDLDLDAGRVSIVQTFVVGGYGVEFSEPKTARGRRMVALDPSTGAGAPRAEGARTALMCDACDDADLIFANADGTWIHPDGFSDSFWRRAKAAKLPRIRFHDLRHTHPTLALAAGVHSKVVSERLRHASITITLDTYWHAIPAMQETAVSLVASLVFADEARDRAEQKPGPVSGLCSADDRATEPCMPRWHPRRYLRSVRRPT
jgi:integrase